LLRISVSAEFALHVKVAVDSNGHSGCNGHGETNGAGNITSLFDEAGRADGGNFNRSNSISLS
jgi:hypothetical protein